MQCACVARGKPSKLFWPWAHLRQIPGFPQHPRDLGLPREHSATTLPHAGVKCKDRFDYHINTQTVLIFMFMLVCFLYATVSYQESTALQLCRTAAAVGNTIHTCRIADDRQQTTCEEHSASLRCSTRLYATTSRCCCCCFCCFCQVTCRRKM